MKLAEKDVLVNWHPYTQMKTAKPPVSINRAQGVYLYDDEDNRYIDAISSWWVNTHGHSHPHIAKAVYDQMMVLEHTIFAGFTHPRAVELSERLLKTLPSHMKRVFYSDNGSTAVEVGLKMAVQYWFNKGLKKNKVIAYHGAYHGDTFGAMSVSERGPFVAPFDDLLFDVFFIDPPIPGKEKESKEQLEAILAAHSDEIACFIFEPLVQGAAGMVMHAPEQLDVLISLCKSHGVIAIADEVMTGFGRTGKFLATDHCKQEPDIICLSKGITGGTMALSATVCTDEIYAAFLSDDKMKTFFHGHSYTANATACAAACASLDLFDQDATWKNVDRIVQRHADFAKGVEDRKGIRDLRQQGTILAMELESGDDTSYFSGIRDSLYDFFMDRSVLLRPLGNVIYILPPYCISDDDLDEVYAAIEACLDTYFN